MSVAKKHNLNKQGKVDYSKNLDIRRFVKSSLFNEVLVLRDIEKEMKHHWENEETSMFIEFWHHLCNFATDYNRNVSNDLNYDETYTYVIEPLLEILGHTEKGANETLLTHNPLILPNSTGDKITINIPALVLRNQSDKSKIIDNEENINIFLKENVVTTVVYDYYDSFADRKIGNYELSRALGSDKKDEFVHQEVNSRCIQYLNALNCSDFGIVTDGAKWRVVSKNAGREDSSLMYEFDLKQFFGLFEGLKVEDIEESEVFLNISKWFFWFFRKESFDIKGFNFLSEIESKTKKYSSIIDEDMKTRFVHAVTIATNGYAKNVDGKCDVNDIVNTSESLVFNLFFVRSCESKGAIPFHQDYKKISLANLIDKIEHYVPTLSWSENSLQLSRLSQLYNTEIKEGGFEIYEHIHDLFKIIKEGRNGFEIKGFIETVFGENEYEIFDKTRLENRLMLGLLHELMFYKDGSSKKQIPYNSFSPRQLGSIYESFLEFKPFKVSKPHFYIKKKVKNKVSWQWVDSSGLKKNQDKSELYQVKKGDYIFSPDNSDRKTTGSYYTPHYIVEDIVRNVLSDFDGEINSIDDVLDLKICDPSMGSGHFLLEALNKLTSLYLSHSSEYEAEDVIRRKILDSCIFGVDINPRAVKLSKMSLWLASAYAGRKLERLDDQLLVGNSLVEPAFNWKKAFKHIFNEKDGFDIVVGNPPYGANFSEEDKEYFNESYETISYQVDSYLLFIEQTLRQIVKPKGSLGYIIPSPWITNLKQGGTRKYLFQNSYFSVIKNFQFKVFKDATVDTHVVILKNVKAMNDEVRIEFYEDLEQVKNQECHNIKKQSQVNWSADPEQPVNLFASREELALFEKIKNDFKNVESYLNVNVGIKPYQKGKGTPKQTADDVKIRVFDSDKKVNKKFRPLLRGSDIGKFSMDVQSNKYIKFGPWLAEPRMSVDWDVEEKIVVRQTGDSIVATIDKSKYICMNNLHVLTLKDSKISMNYVLGIINSSFSEWFYFMLNPEKGETLAEVKRTNVALLPMVFENVDKKIVRKIESSVEKIIKRKTNCSNIFELKDFCEIDKLVFELFKLTEDEISIVNEFRKEYLL